jgi:hypothetical protein
MSFALQCAPNDFLSNPTICAGLHLVSRAGNHGIGLPDGRVAREIPQFHLESNWLIIGGTVGATLMTQFAQGAAPYLFPWLRQYDRFAVAQRAIASLGVSGLAQIAKNGDNFAYHCVTGGPLHDGGSIFGQQLAAKRYDGIYHHHGVGIEGGHVVHFNPPKSGGQQLVYIVPYADFARDDDVVIVSHPNPIPPLATRNRAVNLVGWTNYDLLSNNCEHVATWCVTGKFVSQQVEQKKSLVAGLTAAAVVGVAFATVAAMNTERPKEA